VPPTGCASRWTPLGASGDHFRLVFWIAVIPAALAVVVILFAVREPSERPSKAASWPISRSQIGRLDRRVWGIIAFASFLALARFSEAFLLLRAQDLGLAIRYVPLVLVVMNVAYAASAFPFGRLSDRLGPRRLLVLSILLLVAADITLATAGSLWAALLGAAIWGVHMGASQGVISAMVADRAPVDLRGTAFGMLSLISGLALLGASVVAGGLWTWVGADATFYVGAGIAAAALGGLTLVDR
jgi:MFS family permease